MSYYERNLPHWHPEGRAIFLTWRLYGSLPTRRTGKSGNTGQEWNERRTGKSAGATKSSATENTGQEWNERRTGKSAGATKSTGQDWGRMFRRMDVELDRATRGPRWLSDPDVAGYAEDAIKRGEELGQYVLHAYVVMPNHVHVLLEPRLPLARITRGVKGVSARDANATLHRGSKPFWQDESFDHWVRSQTEFERIRNYIDRNPVSAGLATRPKDWPWSSAHR